MTIGFARLLGGLPQNVTDLSFAFGADPQEGSTVTYKTSNQTLTKHADATGVVRFGVNTDGSYIGIEPGEYSVRVISNNCTSGVEGETVNVFVGKLEVGLGLYQAEEDIKIYTFNASGNMSGYSFPDDEVTNVTIPADAGSSTRADIDVFGDGSTTTAGLRNKYGIVVAIKNTTATAATVPSGTVRIKLNRQAGVI